MQWADNKIGADGARMISEGLKSNSTLSKLDLGSDDDENDEWIYKENRDQNDINKNEYGFSQ